MDLKNDVLFTALRRRFSWLSQRQEVLARNIANADTPDYQAREIEPFRFRDLIRRPAPLRLVATQDAHVAGTRIRAHPVDDEKAKDTYESTPTGNSVVIEEQMAKISETGMAHKLASQLYRKHIEMVRIAVTGRR